MTKFYTVLIRIRSGVLVFLTHNIALHVLRFLRRPQIFPYTAAELTSFEMGTLGHDLINFLERKNLKLLPHYARHDIKHILLQYDTTDEGEVCLQCFMLGNGHLSFPVAATVLFGLITMPEYWHKFKTAFKRGRNSSVIKNWFSILQQPTQSLIVKINNDEKI